MKSAVQIVEVGLRDGLQNESVNLSQAVRVEFTKRLADAGLKRIEIGAFVRAEKVPQMAGSAEVIHQVFEMQKSKIISSRVEFSALVPNERGMNSALESHVKEISIFASCSESFSQKNINCSIEESFKRFEPVVQLARKNKVKVRGYLSVCFGCPYEGPVPEKKVIALIKKMKALGVFEISIGDTIGVATPYQVKSLFQNAKKVVPVRILAGHFHDTRGTALANILAAYETGVRVFDTSLGGLGGCPYAPGARGNVSTEDVAYMFQGMKVKTGLNLARLIETNQWVAQQMGKALPSRVGQAGLFVPKGKVQSSG